MKNLVYRALVITSITMLFGVTALAIEKTNIDFNNRIDSALNQQQELSEKMEDLLDHSTQERPRSRDIVEFYTEEILWKSPTSEARR